MDRKRVAISIAAIAIPIVASCLLYNWGLITLNELGILIVTLSITIAGVLLYLLWNDEATRWWEKRKPKELAKAREEAARVMDFQLRESYYSIPKPSQGFQGHHEPQVKFADAVDTGYYEMQGSFEDVGKIEEARKKIHSEERVLNETPDETRYSSNNEQEELEKLIKPLFLSLDSNRDNPLKGADLAYEDIKRYGNLAQPELRKLLKQYRDIREEWENTKPEDMAPAFHLKHQTQLSNTINQIDILVRKRYDESMWGEKES